MQHYAVSDLGQHCLPVSFLEASRLKWVKNHLGYSSILYYLLTRFMAEVARTKDDLPPRKQIVPDQEEPYPERRIPPVGLDPENVLLCRNVYDFKLKRVLKNPS